MSNLKMFNYFLKNQNKQNRFSSRPSYDFFKLSKKQVSNQTIYSIYLNYLAKKPSDEEFNEDKENKKLMIHPKKGVNKENSKEILEEMRKKKKYQTFYDKVLIPVIDEKYQQDDISFIQLDKNSNKLFLNYIIHKKDNPIIDPCYYKTLGITQETPVKEIKIKFRQIAIKYHPDKNPNTLAYFTHVCNAYEVLTDVKKRADYDDEIHMKENEGGLYLKIGKFKVNVVYVFM